MLFFRQTARNVLTKHMKQILPETDIIDLLTLLKMNVLLPT